MTTATNEGGRAAWIDVAKGIAIIGVILGHLTNYGIVIPHRLVYSFHMPLFFFLAGVTLSFRDSLGRFMVKKARRLILPYLVLGLGALALRCALKGCSAVDVGAWLKSVLYGSAGDLVPQVSLMGSVASVGMIWFLPALFVALVLVRVLYAVRHGTVQYGFFILFFLAVCSSLAWRGGKPWLPFDLQSGCVGAVYLYLGLLCREAGALPCKWPLLSVAGGMAYLYCVLTGHVVWLGMADFSSLAMPFLSCLILFKVASLAEVLGRYRGFIWLSVIGRSSFTVFGLHHLARAGGLVDCVRPCGQALTVTFEIAFPILGALLLRLLATKAAANRTQTPI